MGRRITYKRFYDFLTAQEYSENEIKHLFHKVKSMDAETRGWVADWIDGDGLPDREIEGVTAEDLRDYGLKTINIFIVLDWLKSDPQSAKYFIQKMMLKKPYKPSIDSDIEQQMREFLKSKKADKLEMMKAAEDYSDIDA